MAAEPFSLTSPAFQERGEIPTRFTCEGDDVSPPLAWSAPPPGTQSFALVVDDPDVPDPKAPRMTWVHWVLYNLPSDARELREGAGKGELPKRGARRTQRLEAEGLRRTVPSGRPTPLLPQALRARRRAAGRGCALEGGARARDRGPRPRARGARRHVPEEALSARPRPDVETRPFGPTARRVPLIGQGTWQMERDDRAAAVAALRRGLDAGMTHIDTAEMYGSGSVEELVADAIAGRRDEVFLASKVLPENASRHGTVHACEQSLARLRTDRLDLYLLHWPGEHPLEETVAAFEALRAAGKILAWGVSNFSVEELAEVVRIAGPGRVACNQVLYHLRQRAIEHDLIPFCARNGIAVVAYSPFGSGRFPSRDRALREIAAAHSATPHQVALRFLVRDPHVFAIPKAAQAEHALENAAAGRLALSEDDVRRIDRAFPRGGAAGCR